MAFEAKNFVICSKFQLFKASCNLWLYSTLDTLEDCLAENYFQPRTNLKNQDSPEVGDIIQCIVEGSKLAYLKIVAKTEKPYNITVARTFLNNEAVLIAELARKANKATDFVTPITDENLGLTQTEQSELEEKIDLAANSGRMITAQGVWYAKMYTETVAPSAEDGTNYADFSQTDQHGDPIIVIYERQSGAWVETETVTPPKNYDGYVPVTSKIWDIPEQDGQQGGRILWNHTSEQFTPYPQIVSFDSINITGDSTVEMPVTPTENNIASVGYVNEHFQTAGRNIGDIFFTSRTDTVLNGAVACDGTTYQTTDYFGAQSIGNLLTNGKLPYVSLATYATLLSTNGSVGAFGWDGIGTTAFRVPLLTDIFVETGTAAQIGDYIAPGAPNITGSFVDGASPEGAFYSMGSVSSSNSTAGGDYDNKIGFSASNSSAVYGNSNTIQPNAIRYRAMVQLSVGIQDEAYTNLAQVAYSGSYNDLLNKPTLAAVATSGAYSDLSGTPSLATVATSGSYSDLSNKPTIPAAQVNSDWDAVSGVAQILNKPTIPTVNDATITITQGGVSKGSFTLNQASGDTIALDGAITEIEYAVSGTTTYQQIKSWSDAGKIVLCKMSSVIYMLKQIDANMAIFTSPGAATIGVIAVNTSDLWTTYNVTLPSNLTDLSDVTISTPASGEILMYDGTKWANTSSPAIANADYVIESQNPTAQNNYTWYRKYKSGWVEQGGYIASTSTSDDSKSVTLPVQMANTDYMIQTTVHRGIAGGSGMGWDYVGDASTSAPANTTTTIYLSVASTSYCAGKYWEVKGTYAV